MDVTQLLQLLPTLGGASGAVIMAYMFLKQWDKINELLHLMASKFTDSLDKFQIQYRDELKETRESFQKQLTDVTTKFADQHEKTQAQVAKIADSHREVSQQTVIAINEMKNAINKLEEKVK